MDEIRATPYRSSFAGTANDLIGGLLGYMRDPRRTQQMQGLAGLLEGTGIPKTVERLAFGEPLTNLQQANVPALRPETANALLTLLPVPSGANRAAMAAGRAGERMAERVVPQIMERGGMPAGLLEGLSSRTVSPLTVFHGSPAKFDRFDPTKIGSGEGSQQYGFGHYVSESPAIANSYRAMAENPQKRARITSKETSDQVTKDALIMMNAKQFTGGDTAKLAELIQRRPQAFSDPEGLVKRISEYEGKDVPPSFMYEIDLPDDQIAKMLDFDRPLKDQSPEIQALAKQYGLTDTDHLGGDLIAAMGAKRPEGAEMMRQAGVPGIRHHESGREDRPTNFIVFPGNEDLLTILKRNGGLLD